MAPNGIRERQLHVDFLGKEMSFVAWKHLPCALTGDLYREVIFLLRYGDQAALEEAITTHIIAELTSVDGGKCVFDGKKVRPAVFVCNGSHDLLRQIKTAVAVGHHNGTVALVLICDEISHISSIFAAVRKVRIGVGTANPKHRSTFAEASCDHIARQAGRQEGIG